MSKSKFRKLKKSDFRNKEGFSEIFAKASEMGVEMLTEKELESYDIVDVTAELKKHWGQMAMTNVYNLPSEAEGVAKCEIKDIPIYLHWKTHKRMAVLTKYFRKPKPFFAARVEIQLDEDGVIEPTRIVLLSDIVSQVDNEVIASLAKTTDLDRNYQMASCVMAWTVVMNKLYGKSPRDRAEEFHENLPIWQRYTGAKFYSIDELEDFDILNVANGDRNADLFEEYLKHSDELVPQVTIAQPPLDSGVMKVACDGYTQYIRWKVHDRLDQNFKVTIDAYLSEPYLFLCRFTLWIDELSDFMDSPVFEDADTIKSKLMKGKFPYKKQYKDVEANLFESTEDICVQVLKYYLVGMELFSDLLDTPRDVIKAESEHAAVHYNFTKKGGERRRVINLNGVKVECGRNTDIAIRRGQITRKTDCWGVRGHYRHYQSGKVVYIEPFEKGINRNKGKIKQGKEYRVK